MFKHADDMKRSAETLSEISGDLSRIQQAWLSAALDTRIPKSERVIRLVEDIFVFFRHRNLGEDGASMAQEAQKLSEMAEKVKDGDGFLKFSFALAEFNGNLSRLAELVAELYEASATFALAMGLEENALPVIQGQVSRELELIQSCA